jgi:hypothetical protein
MVRIAMRVIVRFLLFLFASDIVLSLQQQKQTKCKPTGLQTNAGGAEF